VHTDIQYHSEKWPLGFNHDHMICDIYTHTYDYYKKKMSDYSPLSVARFACEPFHKPNECSARLNTGSDKGAAKTNKAICEYI
jgi:hypothetical protein